jgi:hypothetical protein
VKKAVQEALPPGGRGGGSKISWMQHMPEGKITSIDLLKHNVKKSVRIVVGV